MQYIITLYLFMPVVFVHAYTKNVQASGEVPVYKLVLLQILAALGNVSRHIEKVHHGQAGRVLLIKQTREHTEILKIISEAGLEKQS